MTKYELPTLKGTDRILFPQSTDIKKVAKRKCPSCTLNVACAGPKSAGGEKFADLYTRKGVTQILIEKAANCFHPYRRLPKIVKTTL